MKIKKLKDRLGNVFTPLVHKDSVVDTNGVPLKNWIAPVSINGTEQGYSTETDFANGTHISVTNTRVLNADGSYHNSVVMSHDDVERTNTNTKLTPSSGQQTVLVGAISSDSQGHVTQVSSKTITFPTDLDINTADSTIYLVGSPNKTGVNHLKSSESATYDPTLGKITVPLIDAELVGGAKGSIVYQTSTDVTGMLPIGTSHQVLEVGTSGEPRWIDKTNGLISQSWDAGTAAGPKPRYSVENGYGQDAWNTKDIIGPAIPSATESQSGVVTTDIQSFSGDKTFKNNVVVEEDLTVKGNIISTHETDVVVSDKRITLAAAEEATSEVTANGAGIEVATLYDNTSPTLGDKYKGPRFTWDKDSGWTTGNADVTERSTDLNIGNRNASTEGVLRINGVQVLSSTQYIGNSASANKVNHSITFGTNNEKSFDGSASVHIGLNDLGDGPLTVSRGGTGLDSLTADTIMLGNGTNPVQFLTNGTLHQAVVISASGTPSYETLTLDHIPDVTFTLYEDTALAEVDDFAI